MSSATRITERLPSLYRPNLDGNPDQRAAASDLLAQWLRALGATLDEINQAASRVMMAHWLPYADAALLSEFVRRDRELRGDAPVRLGDEVIDTFPYLCDLPRIAALFDRAPLLDPPLFRDRVEDFRERIRDVVALYREGVGTLAAIRLATRIGLPITDRAAAVGLRQRSFTVEEGAPIRQIQRAIQARGQPTDMLGPLMRWRVHSESQSSVLPAVFIQGVTPIPDLVDVTERPLIERVNAFDNTGVGLAYDGTLTPDQTLALWPSFNSWMGMNDGLDRASANGSALVHADPVAAGPWSRVVAAPTGDVVALLQAPDQFLYVAINQAGTGELWKTDGTNFTQVFAGLPLLRCLALREQTLLLGFSSGLSAVDLRAETPQALPSPATLVGAAVNALVFDASANLWAATDVGVARVSDDLTLTMFGPGARNETVTAMSCAFLDADGSLFFGGDLGLFLYQPPTDRWYVYQGGSADEAADDWRLFDPVGGSLPAAETVFLPPVRTIRRGPDKALWLGTDRGIARYLARDNRRTFTTLLEAFPDISQTAVHQIAEDERRQLWFATDSGALMFDGADLWQRQGANLVRLTAVLSIRSTLDQNVGELTQWRYVRASDRWESFTAPAAVGFVAFTGPAAVAAAAPVRVIFWTDGVNAELGSFDGEQFVADPVAVLAPLRTRFKPTALRIVEGGIPAVPRLLAGESEWRYLALEAAVVPQPRAFPAWTIEGRLLPEPQTAAAPLEGRYMGSTENAQESLAFAFNPSARVWLRWQPKELLSVVVRLRRDRADEEVDGVILDRVFQEVNGVRPAGVRVALALDQILVRGGA